MSGLVLMKEGQFMSIDSSKADQVRAMAELMDSDVLKMSQSARGMNLRVDDHIGVLSFSDGTVIGVVPHIKPELTSEMADKVFMNMLYTVYGLSTLGGTVENLFEFFVHSFIDSVNRLINRGLRSKYHLVSGNEKSFKGRIVFNEHIRQNYIHKERIFVEYEYYSQNRPENRLIKTTLEVLSRRTTDSSNIKGLKTLILGLEEIPSSVDVEKDFSQVIIDRNMVDYISPMLWCNLFLKGMGLAGASKDNLSYAMLIRTQDLYSAYVAKMSTIERTEGMYQIRYNADVRNEGDAKGVSVIMIDLDWSFYDRQKDETVNDAEALYLSAPGYRVIPDVGGNRLRSMAGSYLSDVLV